MDNKNILTENKKHLQLDLNHLHKKKETLLLIWSNSFSFTVNVQKIEKIKINQKNCMRFENCLFWAAIKSNNFIRNGLVRKRKY